MQIKNWLADAIRKIIPPAPQCRATSRPGTHEQILLTLQYRQMQQLKMPLPRFDEIGFKVYSESDEDGILHYIFSLISTTNKKLVDIGAAAIEGSNTANLLINHGWTGLLLEGNEDRRNIVQSFYSTCPETRNYPPKVVNAWITRENIDSLLRENGMEGEIDLLSIDIDGIDYYVWQAIDAIRPRVVVLEYQCIWGPEKSLTVPYRPDFKGGYVGRYGVYSGASLAAFVKLGRTKGYRLIGCQRYGYNAFFLRNDIAGEVFAEVAPQECFKHPFTRWAQETFLPKVKEMDWVEV